MKELTITVAFPVVFTTSVPDELYFKAKKGDYGTIEEIKTIVCEQGKQFLDIEKTYPVIACCPELTEIQQK